MEKLLIYDYEIINLIRNIKEPMNTNSSYCFHWRYFNIDSNLQQRVKLNQDTINDYSIALSESEIFPPIIIWRVCNLHYGNYSTVNRSYSKKKS